MKFITPEYVYIDDKKEKFETIEFVSTDDALYFRGVTPNLDTICGGVKLTVSTMNDDELCLALDDVKSITEKEFISLRAKVAN